MFQPRKPICVLRPVNDATLPCTSPFLWTGYGRNAQGRGQRQLHQYRGEGLRLYGLSGMSDLIPQVLGVDLAASGRLLATRELSTSSGPDLPEYYPADGRQWGKSEL